jgi:hypothetical protein
MILAKYKSVQWEPSYSMWANKYDELLQLFCERALKEMFATGQENQQLEKSSKKLTVNILNKTKIIDIGM